jgi:hypothetical protein
MMLICHRHLIGRFLESIMNPDHWTSPMQASQTKPAAFMFAQDPFLDTIYQEGVGWI